MKTISTEKREAIAVGFDTLPPDMPLTRKQARYLVAGQCSDGFMFSLWTTKLKDKVKSTLGEETLTAGEIAEYLKTTDGMGREVWKK